MVSLAKMTAAVKLAEERIRLDKGDDMSLIKDEVGNHTTETGPDQPLDMLTIEAVNIHTTHQAQVAAHRKAHTTLVAASLC